MSFWSVNVTTISMYHFDMRMLYECIIWSMNVISHVCFVFHSLMFYLAINTSSLSLSLSLSKTITIFNRATLRKYIQVRLSLNVYADKWPLLLLTCSAAEICHHRFIDVRNDCWNFIFKNNNYTIFNIATRHIGWVLFLKYTHSKHVNIHVS